MHPIEIIKAIIKCIHGLKRDGLFPEPRRYRMFSGTQEKTLCLLQGFSGLESEQFRRAGTKRNICLAFVLKSFSSSGEDAR